MTYLIIAFVLALSAAANIAPLRAGAACTPATHRARQALGLACGALALAATAMFVRFVVVGGEAVTTNIVVGRVVTVLLAIECALLLRSTFPPRALAIGLAAADVAFAVAAVVHVAL
jgi:hypothetical protein